MPGSAIPFWRSRPATILLVLVALLVGALAWSQLSGQTVDPEEPWEAAPAMPTARSEMPAAVLDGIIYVPGGLGAFARTLSVFEAFDSSDGDWKTLAPLPLPLHHSAAAALGDRVYVSGGYRDLSFTADNSAAWAYDPAEDNWSALAAMPFPRAAHVMVALDGLLYVIGGVGQNSREVWTYDPEADSWARDSAPLPTPREHLTAAVADGRIFVIAGRREGNNVGTVEVYDPAEDSWAPGPDLPTPRSGLTSATTPGEIHVGGGEDLTGEGTFDEHEVLDLEALQWSSGPPLAAPRHGLASVALGGSWYLIGGATRAGAQTVLSLTDSVHVLAVPRR